MHFGIHFFFCKVCFFSSLDSRFRTWHCLIRLSFTRRNAMRCRCDEGKIKSNFLFRRLHFFGFFLLACGGRVRRLVSETSQFGNFNSIYLWNTTAVGGGGASETWGGGVEDRGKMCESKNDGKQASSRRHSMCPLIALPEVGRVLPRPCVVTTFASSSKLAAFECVCVW